MRCLILGGAGFIGSHIADALAERGHTVRVFDIPNVNPKNIREHGHPIELLTGDFNNEKELIPALADMDVVVHLICTTLPGPSNENPIYDVQSNLVGTLRLLEGAKAAGVQKIVFSSTGGAVYGPPRTLPIPETHPTEPQCSYGITKLCVEKYLALYHLLHDLDYVVLRPGNPYGERQAIRKVQGAVAVFLGKTLLKEPIAIWGDGSVARDYFYIGDLTDAFVRVIEGRPPSKIYNIGSGQAYSLNQVLEAIQKVTGINPRVEYSPARKLDVPVNRLDIQRARAELGWQPRVALTEGLARTWEWLKSSR